MACLSMMRRAFSSRSCWWLMPPAVCAACIISAQPRFTSSSSSFSWRTCCWLFSSLVCVSCAAHRIVPRQRPILPRYRPERHPRGALFPFRGVRDESNWKNKSKSSRRVCKRRETNDDQTMNNFFYHCAIDYSSFIDLKYFWCVFFYWKH